MKMRRCYKCGTKKQDDKILCEKCERELNERLGKKNDSNRQIYDERKCTDK